MEDLRSARLATRRAVFVDANIYNSRQYLLRLCSRMNKEGLRLQSATQCTVDIGDDEEVLEALNAAGCLLLLVGFETLGQENLDRCGKQLRAELHLERTRRIQRAGIAVGGYFILGLDADTSACFDATFNFIHGARIALPVLKLLLPAPGTKICEQLKMENRLLVQNEEDFLVNNMLFASACIRSFYIPKNMSSKLAEEEFYKLHQRLSSFRETIRRSATTRPTLAATLLAMNLAMRRECRTMAGIMNENALTHVN